jgi:hypothetical protein
MRGFGVLVVLVATAVFPVAALPATPPVCQVPKLTGSTTAVAKAALKRAGCPSSVLSASTVCAAQPKAGHVLDQKPAAKAALKKGQKIVVHVGKYCPPPPIGPPPPPPPPPPTPANWLGEYSGNYTGTLIGSPGCPDIMVSGLTLFTITQLGTSYDLDILLQNGDVITTDTCDELGRGDSEGELVATASGNSLSADGFTATLTGTTLAGKIQTNAGEIDFTVTHD